jgi:NDP-sugar pyrophosphorylase family protein
MRALVLCGGYGTRLGALTAATPKPLLPAHGRPLLAWILRHLAACGVREALVNLHFHGAAIREAIGDGTALGLGVSYVDEPALLGTAGTPRANLDFLAADGPFLVHYGDVVHDGDLTALLAHHRAYGALATIALHRRKGSNSHVTLAPDGAVEAFVERPSAEAAAKLGEGLVFSGICVLERAALDGMRSGSGDLPRDIFPALAGTGRLRGVELPMKRVAVDSPERLAQLEAMLARGDCAPGTPRRAT